MTYSKPLAIALTTFACAAALTVNADAQTRGRSAGGGSPAVGRAAPRAAGPRVVSPGVIGGAPLRSYYYPYYYGFRPGFSIGLGFGYPYYYGYYGYPYYGAYGYPYYGAYGYSYGYYPPGYPPYGYGGGYVEPRGYGAAYGGIRILGAPRNAEVYVDGVSAGVVDEYNGVFQRLDLAPGPHEIEIRTPGRPLTYDVNVTPGQTLIIHANVR